MADIRLAKPAAGTTQTVPSAPDGRFIFDFPADAATLTRSGDNLVLTFEDGASIQLQDFYTTYSKEEMPSFQVEGVEISGQDFFAALGEDLMPAAGPAAGSSASRSGRYNEYGGSDLLDGLDHLGRLDIGFDGGVQLATDTVEPSPYYEDDHGVTVTPSTPGTDPDDPDIPVQGEDFPPTMPHDVLQVDESALDGGRGGGSATADGSMSVSAPDGVATITIGGVVVWQNGVLTGNPVQTDEGHLDVTGFDGTNLTYTYTLDKATQEHGKEGGGENDAIAHEMEVVVTDSDGDSGSAVIRVEITDDVPVAYDNVNSVTENASASGNVLTDVDSAGKTDSFGADGGSGVTWDLSGYTNQEGGTDGTYTVTDGVYTVYTQYGVATLNPDGSYMFTAKADAGLTSGESASVGFGYTIKDSDGDSAAANLTITISGDSRTPEVTVETPEGSEADIVVDEGSQPEHGGAGHGQNGSGSFIVDLHGEDGTITVGGFTIAIENGVATTSGSAQGVHGVKLSNVKATLGADGKWTVNYDYALGGRQEHGADGTATDADLTGNFPITVTDATGDKATGSIDVTVHDDVPTISSVDADNDGKPDITFERYPDVDSEDTPLSPGDPTDFTKYDTTTDLSTVPTVIWGGQVTISSGRVEYTYSDEEKRIVDTIKILSEGGDIAYSSHVTNGSIGNSVEERKDSMGLTVAGEAEISADRSYDDEGNFTSVADKSDAIIVTLPEGTVAYGLNLKLGAFFTQSSGGGDKWDTVPEQALLTFYKDEEVVLKYPVTANSADGSYTVPADLVITEGFDKVVISAVDNSWASEDNYRLEQSDFVVQEIGFVTLPPNEVMFRYEGDLVSDGGADGFADGYRFAFSDKMGESMQVTLGDKNTVATLTITEGDNGSSILLATIPGDDGKPENLFSVTLDADGHWKFDQYQEFSMPDGSDFELGFMTKDNDGDKAYEEVTLITTTETNLGTSGDHAPTSSADVIVDGNSGHDNFVGDPGGATAGSETTTYPNLNVALVVDKSGSMDDNAGDGSSRMEHMQNALKSLGTQLAEYVQGAPEGTTIDVALIGFAEGASTQQFTVDQLTKKTAIQYEINGHYLSTIRGTQSNRFQSDGKTYRIGADGQLEIQNNRGRWSDIYDFDDSKTTITAFDHAVNNLDPEGGTSYASGFNAAKTWLKGDTVQSDGDKNVVLLVTDGFPGTYQTANSIQDGYAKAVTAYQGLVSAIPGLTVESIGIQLPAELPKPDWWEEGYPAGFPKTPEALLDSLTTGGEAINVTDISQLEGTFTDFIDKVISEGTVTPAADDVILGGRGNDMLFGDALNADYLLEAGYTWAGKEKYIQGSSWDIIQAYLAATLGYPPTEADIAKFISQNAGKLGLTDSITDDTGSVRGGNDTLLGGSGDDIVYGQGGDDLLFGDGSDTVTSNSDIETLETLNRLLTEAGAEEDDSYAERIQGLETQGSQEEPSELDSFIDSLEGTGGIEKDTDGDDRLFGGAGDDVIFGGAGDDFIDGGEGRDTIFGGSGNDIIVYDSNDYLVSGGSGIDFMVSDDTSLTLDGLLSNTGSDKPLVSGIEVLLKGEDALSLTSIKDLADRYGITLRVNEAGEETLHLDDRWMKQDDGSYDFNGGAEADGGLTLETNLTPVETSDPASEAVQQQVFTLEHSNG